MERLRGSMERAWGRLALKDDWALFQLNSTLSLEWLTQRRGKERGYEEEEEEEGRGVVGGGYEKERLEEDLSALPPSKAKPGLFCIRTS